MFKKIIIILMYCCRKKTVPYQDNLLLSVSAKFERDCIRLVCILDQEGKVLSKFNRPDVSDLEIDSVLGKAAAIKTQTMTLPHSNDSNSSVHIQGKSVSCSLFNLPDKNLLVLLLDLNVLTSSLNFVSETRALVSAEIGKIFKSRNHRV
jgi:hypothetical protein